MYRSLISLLSLAAAASTATISITVGMGGTLKFEPNSTTAAVGDILDFHFYPGSGSHSVVSGPFSSPCTPGMGAFFSGYINVPMTDQTGDMTFQTMVNSTDPIWFYCSLDSHCQEGMVGVINPPSGQSISDYAMAAKSVAKASAPSVTPQGGVLTSIVAPSGSASMASSMMTSGMTSVQDGPTGRITSGYSIGAVSPSSTMMSTSMASSMMSSAGASSTMASSAGSAASSSASAAATKSGSSGSVVNSDKSVVLGLAVVVGGLVAMMA